MRFNYSMTTVRKATIEDVTSLANIAEKTFRATFSADNSTEDMNLHCQKNFGESLQRRELLDQDTVTLLCEDGAVLAGFAQLCWKEVPSCLSAAESPGEIRRIYVLEDFHGRGAAQALMKASIAEMEVRKSEVVWLGVWEKNPRAIAFYKKLSFTEVGEHEFYLGNDRQRDIIMARGALPHRPPG